MTEGQSSTSSHATAPARHQIAIWWRAIRPKSFTATTTPIAVGVALAAIDGYFAPGWAALTLLAALLLQAGTNLTNDYFDHRSGVDSTTSLSPSGVIQQALLAPRAVLIGGLGCFALSAALGIALALHGGPWIWSFGVVGLLIGLLYTAGPFPLAYKGFGEVVVFIAMGPAMVLGTYIVQTGIARPLALAAGIPIGLLVAAIMHANNVRDIETDRQKGKWTLAARFGRTFARREYAFLITGAYAALLALAVFDRHLTLGGLAAFLTLPSAQRLVQTVYETDNPEQLNSVLRGTAVLHGRFGALWAAGLALIAAGRALGLPW